MASQATVTLTHPTIGQMKGVISDDEKTVQFKGIQCATLHDRFAPPELSTYTPNSTIDATHLGPQVLSIAPGPEAEFGLIQHSLDYDKSELRMSDTDSLCLNITLPANTPADAGLPVFVFIHGGGFQVGSGMWPQYDMSRFVALSVELGKPLIAVVMNYRLGAPGLLFSPALGDEEGWKANNALRDQRTALQWVKKHIAVFGGDPEAVTLAGESAGGVSVCYHLFSEEKLFARCLSMSGTHLLIPPLSPEEAEAEFRKAATALGLQDESHSAVFEKMKAMDGEEMTGTLMAAGLRLAPVVDNDIVPHSFRTSDFQAGGTGRMPGLDWCKGFMIGDCAFDGSIRALDLARFRGPDLGHRFRDAVSQSLPLGVADRVCDAYALGPQAAGVDETFERVLQVVNDLNFYAPTTVLSSYLRCTYPRVPVYGYRFNVPNPWPGQWAGRSSHILDISLLFQNYNGFLNEQDKAVARKFGEDVVSFIHGGELWGRTAGEGQKEDGVGLARVYGGGGSVRDVEDVPGEETGRRGVIFELAEMVGWDKLDEAIAAFGKGG